MRIGWIGMALLALNGHARGGEFTVHVSMDSAAGTYAAKRIAASVFAQAGVRIVWRTAEAPIAGPFSLHIHMSESTPDELLPGALAVAYPYGGCTRSIAVFRDRIRLLSVRGEREPALLAYVLIHEITHVLQGIDRHSDAGIMKARWNEDDRAAIFASRLRFDEEDTFLMRKALGEGGPCRTLTVTARSAAGTARRPE